MEQKRQPKYWQNFDDAVTKYEELSLSKEAVRDEEREKNKKRDEIAGLVYEFAVKKAKEIDELRTLKSLEGMSIMGSVDVLLATQDVKKLADIVKLATAIKSTKNPLEEDSEFIKTYLDSLSNSVSGNESAYKVGAKVGAAAIASGMVAGIVALGVLVSPGLLILLLAAPVFFITAGFVIEVSGKFKFLKDFYKEGLAQEVDELVGKVETILDRPELPPTQLDSEQPQKRPGDYSPVYNPDASSTTAEKQGAPSSGIKPPTKGSSSDSD